MESLGARVRKGLFVGAKWAFYGMVVVGLGYAFISSLVMGYLEARKAEQDRQEVAIAMLKIRADFEDYLQAAPILRGNTSRAFERVVNEKLGEIGFDRRDQRISGLAPAQRWRKGLELANAEELAIRDRENRAAEDFAKCIAIFDADRCELMIAGAYCLTEGCPNAEAAELFDDAAFGSGYVRESESIGCW